MTLTEHDVITMMTKAHSHGEHLRIGCECSALATKPITDILSSNRLSRAVFLSAYFPATTSPVTSANLKMQSSESVDTHEKNCYVVGHTIMLNPLQYLCFLPIYSTA